MHNYNSLPCLQSISLRMCVDYSTCHNIYQEWSLSTAWCTPTAFTPIYLSWRVAKYPCPCSVMTQSSSSLLSAGSCFKYDCLGHCLVKCQWTLFELRNLLSRNHWACLPGLEFLILLKGKNADRLSGSCACA